MIILLASDFKFLSENIRTFFKLGVEKLHFLKYKNFFKSGFFSFFEL